MKAIDIMTTEVISVSPNTPIDEVVDLLSTHHISAVPVVNDDGSVVGILSENDLIRATFPESHTSMKDWLKSAMSQGEKAERYVKAHGQVASDIMTKKVITVTDETSVQDIARKLETNRIKRVPVVRDGKLIGIVSRANLLHGIASKRSNVAFTGVSDDRTIRDKILKALVTEAGIDGGAVNVTVNKGHVELWGMVGSDTEKRAAQLAAEECVGVSSVDNNLGTRPSLVLGD